jgi:hypothetical protein
VVGCIIVKLSYTWINSMSIPHLFAVVLISVYTLVPSAMSCADFSYNIENISFYYILLAFNFLMRYNMI